MPGRERAVLFKKDFFFLCIAMRGIVHIKKIVHGDVQRTADVRKKIDIRSASAVFPVADGVRRNANLFCQLLLFHIGFFAEETDSFAQNGDGGIGHCFPAFYIDDTGGPFCGTVNTSPWHASLLSFMKNPGASEKDSGR